MDIVKVPLPQLIHQLGDQLAEWWRLHGGFAHWSDDRAKYIETLQQAGYLSWTIESAVGFEGFAIAKRAEQIEDENHPKT